VTWANLTTICTVHSADHWIYRVLYIVKNKHILLSRRLLFIITKIDQLLTRVCRETSLIIIKLCNFLNFCSLYEHWSSSRMIKAKRYLSTWITGQVFFSFFLLYAACIDLLGKYSMHREYALLKSHTKQHSYTPTPTFFNSPNAQFTVLLLWGSVKFDKPLPTLRAGILFGWVFTFLKGDIWGFF
jgi:hypothetical protein